MEASGTEINNIGEKHVNFYTDNGAPAAMKFQACPNIDKFIASVSKIVDKRHRVVYDDEGSYIENKKTSIKFPLVRNSINGLWYMNAYHLPKDLIAKLNAGDFHRQGK